LPPSAISAQWLNKSWALSRDHRQLEAYAWDEARFKPIPPIIDAAVALYSNMNVFEIGHSCAAREDLLRTTERLVKIVSAARKDGTRTICFVTGIPGAGKTLVGLNAVHERGFAKLDRFCLVMVRC